jgi:trk system potassium uptake protein TrkH
MAKTKQRGFDTSGRWELAVGSRFNPRQRTTPAQLFVGSFALLIVAGTFALRWLPGLYVDKSLSWLDCLFTATSAICVTGLTVVDTGAHFTFWGQVLLLGMIQLGGLGMLTLTSMIIISLGRRLSLRQEALYTGPTEGSPYVDPQRLIFDVVRFTLIFEALGAAMLYALWVPQFGWQDAAWPAVFHSVSAFCNAGFSIFPDSLVDYQQSPLSLFVVMALIVTGGIGFLTLEEIYLRYRPNHGKQVYRISLHSKMVISTTVALLLGGWLLFAIFEWNGTLANLGAGSKAVNALFISVTCRTAGFHTIHFSEAEDSTNFLAILLMMIGGSPGSTAGGMKTTTFALIGVLAWCRFQGLVTPSVWRRSLRDEITQRAIGLFVVAVGVVTVGVFAFTISEGSDATDRSFLVAMFESVSAFNTVGLSMGLTTELSAFGKWTTIVLMFFGRVGPLALAAALMLRQQTNGEFRYAYEDVVIG